MPTEIQTLPAEGAKTAQGLLRHEGAEAGKADANLAKHGVTFELAAPVFEDPFQLNEADEHPDGDRRRTIGVPLGITLFVVHTVIEPDLSFGRIIGARRATPHERRRYEKSLLS